MELILWRHADAADGFPDLERPLTDKGLKQAEHMANFLRTRIPPDTRIISSPALRTRQTALALSRHFLVDPEIAPDCDVHAILKAANWPHSNNCVIIVGHQPVLGATIGNLLCSRQNGISVKKGAIWWLSRRIRSENEETILKLSISPDLL